MSDLTGRRLAAPGVLVAVAAMVTCLFGVTLWTASPADAAARVSIANQFGEAAVDPTYATTLTLRGNGFQSIAKGHGGIYVMFGAVRGQWRPSKGGASGQNYFTVPDTETKNNAGFLKYVAFPGSDTASAANGGVIKANGSWSTKINVPGATFKTYNRAGKVTTIDCRKMTCGIITFGAHGVANANNETFTPVKIKSLYDAQPQAQQTEAAPDEAQQTEEPAAQPAEPQASAGDQATAVPTAAPELTVDRASARAGRVLAFSATGLRPGSQISATFDNGRAGAGPYTVGANGQVAGQLQLPADLTTGTYELRLVGEGELPSVSFGVVADQTPPGPVSSDRRPVWFAAAGGVALLAAIAVAVLRRRRRAHAS